MFLLWPLFLFIIIAVFVTSGWPVFFIQQRVGYQKRSFPLIKFRTMTVGAEKQKKTLLRSNEAPWPMFKMKDDPRFTVMGKFLSKSGLDELPQLVNILKGEMSLVGPRPLPVAETKKLGKDWDFRYKVKPGVISNWAIDPNRYHSLATWMKLEKQTVKSGNFGEDFKLLLSTIKFLFK